MKKVFCSLFLIVFLLVQNAYCIFPLDSEELVGKKAPAIELSDISGNKFSFSSFSEGKVILLNFWATYCPPCVNEMPSINNLYNAYKDKGFAVVAVSRDKSPDKAIEFKEKAKLEFPILFDNGGAAKSYNIVALPTTVLISRDGNVAGVFVGEMNWMDEESRKLIEGLIEAKPADKTSQPAPEQEKSK